MGVFTNSFNRGLVQQGSLLNPPAPTDIQLSVVSDTQNDLSWESDLTGVYYEVERSTDTFVYSKIGETNEDVKSFSDTGLTAGVTYYYRLRAKKGSSNGVYGYLGLNFAWMRYWETNPAVNNVYYASPAGSGADSTFANPSTFNTAIGKATSANDAVVLLPGTFNYINGTELDYKGVGANGVTISGLTQLRSDVVIDFDGLGDPGGWLYVNGKTDVKLQFLTVKNYREDKSGATVIYLLGDSSGSIQNCEFKDYCKKAILLKGSALQGKWIIEKNIFSGVNHDGTLATGSSIHIDGASAPVNVEIRYNVFKPSALNLGGGIVLANSPSVSRNVDFYNNEFYGTWSYCIYSFGHNYTGNVKNNVFSSHMRAISGECNGYSSSVDFNYVSGAGSVPNYYDSEITEGTNDVLGNWKLKPTKYPNKSWMTIGFDDGSAWNTNGWNNLISLLDAKGWKLSSFIDVKYWDSLYGGTPPAGETITYVNNGHDIGVHSFSHNRMTVFSNAIEISYAGGGTKSVNITTDLIASGADWKTINKDYTQWSGSITIDVGGVEEDTLTLSGGIFLTLEDVKTWIDSHADWSATVSQDGDATHVASGALAITLENQTVDIGATATAFDVVETPYLWLETKYAKDRLESIVSAVIGSSYTVKTWACPFNLSSTNLMDALMEAGYTAARGKSDMVAVGSDGYNSRRLALFSLYNFALPITGSDETTAIDLETISWQMSRMVSLGGAASLVTHTQGFDNETELTVISALFDIYEDFEARGLNIMSLREFADYVESNSTVIGGTTGQDIRYLLDNIEQFNGERDNDSCCIDAGVDVGLTTDIEDTAVGTPPNIGAYE